ncbi:MAG: sigma-54-dependent Fis family transcriptional regulator [Acidobacteriota bacterium]|nr:sigma-54-dependent Fis family transcriptional regulator [Acidobacteriota bacterium]
MLSLEGTEQVAEAAISASEPRSSATAAWTGAPGSSFVPALQLLVVDDDAAVRRTCVEISSSRGCVVQEAAGLQEAREVLRCHKVDLLLLDLRLPGGSGLSLLEEVRAQHPDTFVVVMTAFATVSSAVEAMRIGAGDYLTKPFAMEELVAVLERGARRVAFQVESRRLRERLRTTRGMGPLVGQVPEMQKLYRMLSKVAFTSHPVLITGEAGTGKELVGRAMHDSGPNPARPFVVLDCSHTSGSVELLEGELFGVESGGTLQPRQGLLSAPSGGTVYLDEVGDLPHELQTRLLRALQEKTVRPVGSSQVMPLTARVLAASSRDLNGLVERGQFRKDLYFRLNIVHLHLPALRERKADIGLLAMHFLERLDVESGGERSRRRSFSSETLALMQEYEWPGNVRELEQAIERACALSSGPVVHLNDLPTQLQEYRRQRIQQPYAAAQPEEPALDRLLDTDAGGRAMARPRIVSIAAMEREAILGTIQQLKGDKLMAARLLGIGKTTLYRKLKEYGLMEAETGGARPH